MCGALAHVCEGAEADRNLILKSPDCGKNRQGYNLTSNCKDRLVFRRKVWSLNSKLLRSRDRQPPICLNLRRKSYPRYFVFSFRRLMLELDGETK